jgi:hypothetical protein
MSEYLPKFFPGDTVTIAASATITGGQLVTWTGAVAGDNATGVAGVAGHDAASGDSLTVYRIGVHTLTADGAITKGDPICSAASGAARKWVDGIDKTAAHIGTATATAADAAPVNVAVHGC